MGISIGVKPLEYHQIDQSDRCEGQEWEENAQILHNSNRSCLQRHGIAVLLATILCLTIICSAWLVSSQNAHLNAICTKHISQYSPVTHDVEIRFETIRFNGSLLKENIFRQAAGPEVDAAWDSLGVNCAPSTFNYEIIDANPSPDRSVLVPAAQAEKSNILPDQVKVNEKYGGGFPANVEGLHHLHCLDVLRKALYYNFDYYHALGQGPFANADNIIRLHVTHCLDIIRQQLMCTVDVGVLGQVWWNQEAPEAYVDFNTKHTCRNFEDIRKWAEAHQLPSEVPFDYLQPPRKGDTVYESIP